MKVITVLVLAISLWLPLQSAWGFDFGNADSEITNSERIDSAEDCKSLGHRALYDNSGEYFGCDSRSPASDWASQMPSTCPEAFDWYTGVLRSGKKTPHGTKSRLTQICGDYCRAELGGDESSVMFSSDSSQIGRCVQYDESGEYIRIKFADINEVLNCSGEDRRKDNDGYYISCNTGQGRRLEDNNQQQYSGGVDDQKVAEIVKEPFKQDKKLAQAIEACVNKKEDLVQNTCNSKNESFNGLSSGIDKVLNGPLAHVASIATACSKMSDTLLTAQNTIGAFKLACTAGIEVCHNTCAEAVELIGQKEKYCSTPPESCPEGLDTLSAVDQKKCKGKWFCEENPDNKYGTQASLSDAEELSKKNGVACGKSREVVAKAEQQLQVFAKNIAVAQACKNKVAAKPMDNSNGGIDCSDAANASLLTCVCQANPRDPACPSSSKPTPGSGGGGLVNNNSGPASGAPKGISSEDINNDINSLGNGGNSRFAGPPEGNTSGSQASTKGFGKGGGSAAPGGGGSGSSRFASSSSGRNRSFSSARPNVVSGYIGGGRRSGSSSSGRFLGGAGSTSTARGSSVKGRSPSRFDLKKFLPGSQAMRRRIAGVTGKDGITGPNGMGLFEKVSFRIKKEKSRLLP